MERIMVTKMLKISDAKKTLRKVGSQWNMLNALLFAFVFDSGKCVMVYFPKVAFELFSILTGFGVILVCLLALSIWIKKRH
jgi:hypothetical protein